MLNLNTLRILRSFFSESRERQVVLFTYPKQAIVSSKTTAKARDYLFWAWFAEYHVSWPLIRWALLEINWINGGIWHTSSICTERFMLISDYSRLLPVDIKCQIYRAYLGLPKHLFSEIWGGCFVYAEGFFEVSLHLKNKIKKAIKEISSLMWIWHLRFHL